MSVNFSLEGKVALVTGASYGIGFAIASGLWLRQVLTIVFNDITARNYVDKGSCCIIRLSGIDAQGLCLRCNRRGAGE